jgi:hypothetical protein
LADFKIGSLKALIKCAFLHEVTMRSTFIKNGLVGEAFIFGLVKPGLTDGLCGAKKGLLR